MKKNIFPSIISQLILLVFVIVWILPTFGLFISSLRDKDLLANSGWWTSLITNEINEIYRTGKQESQFQQDNFYQIKGNFFNNVEGKKISSFGVTSKSINEYFVGDRKVFELETKPIY